MADAKVMGCLRTEVKALGSGLGGTMGRVAGCEKEVTGMVDVVDFKHRMSMVHILVDENPCYTFGNVPNGGSRDLTVNCTSGVMFGRVVRVAKFNMSDTGGDYAINLCEFQIFSCSAHYYGSNCDQRCGVCLNDSPCDKQTGECDMCGPGWKPTPLCDE
ncbi:hypothetical protein BaRGS_00032239, partial [Batillaria attramentaria]